MPMGPGPPSGPIGPGSAWKSDTSAEIEVSCWVSSCDCLCMSWIMFESLTTSCVIIWRALSALGAVAVYAPSGTVADTAGWASWIWERQLCAVRRRRESWCSNTFDFVAWNTPNEPARADGIKGSNKEQGAGNASGHGRVGLIQLM